MQDYKHQEERKFQESQADLLIKQMGGANQECDDFDDQDNPEANDIIDELIVHRNNDQANAQFAQSRESLEMIKGLVNEIPNGQQPASRLQTVQGHQDIDNMMAFNTRRDETG